MATHYRFNKRQRGAKFHTFLLPGAEPQRANLLAEGKNFKFL